MAKRKYRQSEQVFKPSLPRGMKNFVPTKRKPNQTVSTKRGERRKQREGR